MPFTSPSVANKNNIFHIGPRIRLQIIVQECAVFNILQKASLIVPVIPVLSPHQLPIGEKPVKKECIHVERVVDSCYTADENIVRMNIFREPEKIISCTINSIIQQDKLIPYTSGNLALAAVIYTYNIEVKYIDSSGKLIAVNQRSNTRYQRAVVSNAAGYLEVKLNLSVKGMSECMRIKNSFLKK